MAGEGFGKTYSRALLANSFLSIVNNLSLEIRSLFTSKAATLPNGME